ncbi:MAG: ImmA/IrrE family metallo-endopeptidase [Lachnospiraceae bacterium]|nr:ImmA/IrrE family metallo-endopeptidase [Lachnospiraceae bacterium]
MLDKLDLNTKAQELRELLGEDANSPVDIFSLVNQVQGLTLVFYPLGENISGICVRDRDVRLIAINSSMSYGRQRFSLAHELYHLCYDDESGFNVCSKKLDPKSENERCADQFASYFLAPYKSLRTAIRKTAGESPLSMKHVIALEQYFGMSHLAMLWRLVSEGLLTADALDSYSCGVISAARSLGYDDKLYKPTPAELRKRTYGHYLKQVEELRQKDLVSPGKIDELLLDAFRDDIAFGLDEEEQGVGTID